ncbi:MAG TPA: rhomboid family intramembrane serine protease [Verrucomicrobiae bacterium]|nr:rhomboid family intramembrane serine protease [Verrucomicrobiae bacterium]
MLDSWDQPKVRGPFRRFSNPFRDLVTRFGSVVQLIIAINVIVFFLQLICTSINFPYFERFLALSADGIRRGFLWQLVTYMFLHDGIWHILINLFILWFFGREVEYFIGQKYFTRLYFMAGIAGAALWLAFNFMPVNLGGNLIYPTCLGASAAVLGCVIAFATLFPDREITLLVFFILPVRMKAKYMALIAIAFDIVPLLQRTGGGVAHLAHIGGAAFGYLYIKQLGYGTTPRWLLWLQDITARLKPRPRPTPRNMTSEEFIRQEIDPILDKIAREGMQSLTRRERKILESAKDLMQKRQR